MFLAQGTIDQIIRLDVTKNYMSKLCKTGSKVKMRILPNMVPRCPRRYNGCRKLDFGPRR